MFKMLFNSRTGQTLLEVVVAVGIALVVVGALTVAATNAVRNASLSKNQTQATRLAQDGIEKARALRDLRGFAQLNLDGGANFAPSTCVILNLQTSPYVGATSGEVSQDIFTRCIEIFPTPDNPANSLTVRVTVQWKDALGDHNPGSELRTYLTNWKGS